MIAAEVYEIIGAARKEVVEGTYEIVINTNRGFLTLLTSSDWLQVTRIMQFMDREINAATDKVLRSTLDNLLAQGN